MRSLLNAVLAIAALTSHAEEWSRFRGPNGSGVSHDTGFPTEFSKTKNVIWRAPVRPGKSSPVLTKRHIYVAAYDNGKLYTQCFERKDGKLLWERWIDRARVEDTNKLNEPASITPVSDGDNVYVFFKEYGLISYDAAGKLRWKTPLGPFTNPMGLASSPILAGDLIVVQVDGEENSYIAAFDRRNGEIRWKTERDERQGWATPLQYRSHDGRPLILTAGRGILSAYLAGSGKRIWTRGDLSPSIVASPVLNDDTVYVFGYGSESASPFSGQLARRDKNGDGRLGPDEYGDDAYLTGIAKYEGNHDGIITQEEWDAKQRKVIGPSVLSALRLERDGPRELWRYEKNFTGVVPSPLVYQGVVYVVKNGGILTSFDSKTGQVVKAARLPGAVSGYSSSPVAAEGRIFLASEDGKIAVLKAGAEWDLLVLNDLGEPCYATPAFSEGHIYLRTSEALYRFGTTAP